MPWHPDDWLVALGIVTGLLAGLLYLVRAEVNRSFTRIANEVREQTRAIQPQRDDDSITTLNEKTDMINDVLQGHLADAKWNFERIYMALNGLDHTVERIEHEIEDIEEKERGNVD